MSIDIISPKNFYDYLHRNESLTNSMIEPGHNNIQTSQSFRFNSTKSILSNERGATLEMEEDNFIIGEGEDGNGV